MNHKSVPIIKIFISLFVSLLLFISCSDDTTETADILPIDSTDINPLDTMDLSDTAGQGGFDFNLRLVKEDQSLLFFQWNVHPDTEGYTQLLSSSDLKEWKHCTVDLKSDTALSIKTVEGLMFYRIIKKTEDGTELLSTAIPYIYKKKSYPLVIDTSYRNITLLTDSMPSGHIRDQFTFLVSEDSIDWDTIKVASTNKSARFDQNMETAWYRIEESYQLYDSISDPKNIELQGVETLFSETVRIDLDSTVLGFDLTGKYSTSYVTRQILNATRSGKVISSFNSPESWELYRSLDTTTWEKIPYISVENGAFTIPAHLEFPRPYYKAIMIDSSGNRVRSFPSRFDGDIFSINVTSFEGSGVASLRWSTYNSSTDSLVSAQVERSKDGITWDSVETISFDSYEYKDTLGEYGELFHYRLRLSENGETVTTAADSITIPYPDYKTKLRTVGLESGTVRLYFYYRPAKIYETEVIIYHGNDENSMTVLDTITVDYKSESDHEHSVDVGTGLHYFALAIRDITRDITNPMGKITTAQCLNGIGASSPEAFSYPDRVQLDSDGKISNGSDSVLIYRTESKVYHPSESDIIARINLNYDDEFRYVDYDKMDRDTTFAYWVQIITDSGKRSDISEKRVVEHLARYRAPDFSVKTLEPHETTMTLCVTRLPENASFVGYFIQVNGTTTELAIQEYKNKKPSDTLKYQSDLPEVSGTYRYGVALSEKGKSFGDTLWVDKEVTLEISAAPTPIVSASSDHIKIYLPKMELGNTGPNFKAPVLIYRSFNGGEYELFDTLRLSCYNDRDTLKDSVETPGEYSYKAAHHRGSMLGEFSSAKTVSFGSGTPKYYITSPAKGDLLSADGDVSIEWPELFSATYVSIYIINSDGFERQLVVNGLNDGEHVHSLVSTPPGDNYQIRINEKNGTGIIYSAPFSIR